MALASSIEWTQASWNPITGCTKLSPGCAHCYAERFALRLKRMGNPRYACGFQVTTHPDLLQLPLKWKTPRLVFVNSMSDLFHDAVPYEFIASVFDAIESAPWHIFQVLTKRAERLAEVSTSLPWPRNLWVGVSVERQDYMWRVEYLHRVDAACRLFRYLFYLSFLYHPFNF
jgi:protein gp37